MRRGIAALRASFFLLLAVLMSACGKAGIDAGGETTSNNGGVAFILLTAFLVVGGLILWFILGRED